MSIKMAKNYIKNFRIKAFWFPSTGLHELKDIVMKKKKLIDAPNPMYKVKNISKKKCLDPGESLGFCTH